MNEYLATVSQFLKNPAWDIVLIGFFLVAGFLWGTMSGGRAKLYSFLFASYVALFASPTIFKVADTYKFLTNTSYQRLAIYGVFFLVVFLIFDQRIFSALPRTGYRWWQAFVMSFLEVGLFVAGTLSIINFRGIIEFSSLTKTLFVGPSAYLFWALAPILGLLLVSKNK
ncbi:MAG: hypothetical protein AAB372_04130 [Patescibacteria group bacterium]|mgnify:CR=1 FL=1